jgi:hypothetical protein
LTDQGIQSVATLHPELPFEEEDEAIQRDQEIGHERCAERWLIVA